DIARGPPYPAGMERSPVGQQHDELLLLDPGAEHLLVEERRIAGAPRRQHERTPAGIDVEDTGALAVDLVVGRQVVDVDRLIDDADDTDRTTFDHVPRRFWSF